MQKGEAPDITGGQQYPLPEQSPCPGPAALAQGKFVNTQLPNTGGQALTQSSNPDENCGITQVTPFQGCYTVLLS